MGAGTCCEVLGDIRKLYPIHGVAITGHGDETHRQAAIAAGYANYLRSAGKRRQLLGSFARRWG
jgi:hypothetical protein